MDNIYITGFMGVGKSTVGRLLAKRLGRKFTDVDNLIEQEAGMTIADIFRDGSETCFRKIETKMLKKMAKQQRAVISLGGGCILKKCNRQLIGQTGKLIYLNADPLTILGRLRHKVGERPLLSGCFSERDLLNRLNTMIAQRRNIYQSADLKFSTDQKKPEQVVEDIVTVLNSTRPITIHTVQAHSYSVEVGEGILSATGSLLENCPSLHASKKGFVFIDSNVKRQAKLLASALRRFGWDVHTIKLRVNELLKNFNRIYPIYGRLHKMGADRKSVIFVLGGGVVGDAIGFVAASYLRGLPWVCIPTTLLAQVDSAIGGKTGVDHVMGKNLVGAFHQPSLVICDVDILRSLSKRDLVSGFGEMVKCGLICDPKLFDDLRRNWKSVLSLDKEIVVPLIKRCIWLKKELVERDEKDISGCREVLNFGHTFGHALENEAGYCYFRHGEAVIWGMRFAIEMSLLKKCLSREIAMEVDGFLRELPVPQIPRHVKIGDVITRIKCDKKRRDGNIKFVLLDNIGRCVMGHTVTFNNIREVFNKIVGTGKRQ